MAADPDLVAETPLEAPEYTPCAAKDTPVNASVDAYTHAPGTAPSATPDAAPGTAPGGVPKHSPQSAQRNGPADPPANGPADPPKPASASGSAPVSSREIWALTWPQALTMLLQFVVSFTDVAVAGHIHPHLQGAIGIITQLQFFLLVLGIAFVNGGMAAMSQSLGAKLPLRSEHFVGLLFKAGGAMCLLTFIFGALFSNDLLSLMQVPEDIFDITHELWLGFLPIVPISYLSFTTTAIFRAHKKVWVPLISAFIVCVINGIADLGFGLGMFGMPNMGGFGLIVATIFSVLAGGLFNLAVLIKQGLLSRHSFASWRWDRKALPYILKVAIPAGGSQLLWQLGYLVLFVIANTLPSSGTVAVSGLTAGMRVEALLFMPTMAFNITGSILVGRCLGAGDRAEARRVGLRVVCAGAFSMAVLAACLYPFVGQITAFLSPEDIAVQEVASSYLVFNLIATPFTVTSMIMSGIFSGAGATVYSLIAFTVGTWLVRLPLAWYLGHIVWQNPSGIFFAMVVSQVVQVGICLYFFFFHDWYRFALTAKRFSRRQKGAEAA